MPTTAAGRADWSKVKPEEIREYRLLNCRFCVKVDKGKQPVCGGEQSWEASESGASPSMMLSALNIGTASSGSPGIASGPPSARSHSPSLAAAPAISQAEVYAEVPAPSQTAEQSPASPPATPEAAAPQLSSTASHTPTTILTPLFLPFSPTPPPPSRTPHFSPPPLVLPAPAATRWLPPPSPSAPAPAAHPAPPALPALVAAATSLATAASPARVWPPVAGPSAIPFAHHQLNICDWHRPFGARRLLDNSGQQQDIAANLNSQIQSLERRADEFEEWKCTLEERLKAAGL